MFERCATYIFKESERVLPPIVYLVRESYVWNFRYWCVQQRRHHSQLRNQVSTNKLKSKKCGTTHNFAFLSEKNRSILALVLPLGYDSSRKRDRIIFGLHACHKWDRIIFGFDACHHRCEVGQVHQH